MLQRTPLLNPRECQQIVDSVRDLRRYWRARHPSIPSFTLGAASYLDIPESGLSGYLASTVRTRSRLMKHFTDLYERVRSALATHLGDAEVLYHPQLALPGFHIFESHPDIAMLRPKLHFDRQHLHFEWDDPEFDAPGHRRSFTVPLALPAAGSGLYVWPITFNDVGSMAESERAEGVQNAPDTFVDYVPGELVIHSGDQLHQIAAGQPGGADESRVTLQGHAIKDGDRWWLYW